MRPDEGEQLLAFVLRKDYRRRFGTRHITLHSTEDRRDQDGVLFYENLAVA
jgi:hypothetical protein